MAGAPGSYRDAVAAVKDDPDPVVRNTALALLG
jgi:hypothetical protein